MVTGHVIEFWRKYLLLDRFLMSFCLAHVVWCDWSALTILFFFFIYYFFYIYIVSSKLDQNEMTDARFFFYVLKSD